MNNLELLIEALEKTANYIEAMESNEQNALDQEKLLEISPVVDMLENNGEEVSPELLEKLKSTDRDVLDKLSALAPSEQRDYKEFGKLAEEAGIEDNKIDPILAFCLK